MKISAEELATMLLVSSDQSGPLYLRLSVGISDLIGRGDLPPGCSLPSERALAAETHISRTTVVAAYRHQQDSGHIERKEGSGTRVCLPTSGQERETVSIGKPSSAAGASQFLYAPPTTIDLATAALPGLPMVAEAAASIKVDEYQGLLARNHAYDPRGLADLRRAIADKYTEGGVPTSESEILITSGAQQAIEVVTTGCLQPGDPVVIEQPAYRGALEAFARAQCRVEEVRCDVNGMVMTELERTLSSRPARMIYIQTEVQNPTGARMSPASRRRLLELAGQHGTIVVDDTSLADTVFDGSPRALLSSSGESPVISIGSMNKLFWSGLRLGWIRADADVISRLAQMKGLADFGTSVLGQHIAIRLLDRLEEARAQRREGLQRSLAIATGLLGELLPSWEWWEPRGGPSLWVQLPHGQSSQFASMAMRYGVAVLPAAAFSARGAVSRYVRLPYALPERHLMSGIDRLARAWSAFEKHGPLYLPLHSVST